MEPAENKKAACDGPVEGRKPYVPPRLVTYTSERILTEIGVAQACSPFNPSCPTEKAGRRKPTRRK